MWTSEPEPTDDEREMAAKFFLGLGRTSNWTEELAKLLARHRDSTETACMCPGPHG